MKNDTFVLKKYLAVQASAYIFPKPILWFGFFGQPNTQRKASAGRHCLANPVRVFA